MLPPKPPLLHLKRKRLLGEQCTSEHIATCFLLRSVLWQMETCAPPNPLAVLLTIRMYIPQPERTICHVPFMAVIGNCIGATREFHSFAPP